MNRYSNKTNIQVPRTRWAILRGASNLWRRGRAASGELPAGTWKRWWISLSVALLISLVLSAALTLMARAYAPRGLDDWDMRTLRGLEQSERLSVQQAILIESPGNLSYLIPLTATVAIAALLLGRPVYAASIVAAYVLMRLIVGTGWWIWDRARPDVILDGAASPPLHSFPSGHIALAISVYGLLAYLWIERSNSTLEKALAVLLTLAWCAIVGIARVRLGTHWPSDVIAGAILGVIWVTGVIISLRRAEASRKQALD